MVDIHRQAGTPLEALPRATPKKGQTTAKPGARTPQDMEPCESTLTFPKHLVTALLPCHSQMPADLLPCLRYSPYLA